MLLKLARFEKKKVLAKKPTLAKKLYLESKYEQLNLFHDISILKEQIEIADNLDTSEIQARYYIITLEQDLFGNYVITRINGRLNTALGQTRQEVLKDEVEAKKRFYELVKYREKVRHYQLITLKNFDEK